MDYITRDINTLQFCNSMKQLVTRLAIHTPCDISTDGLITEGRDVTTLPIKGNT